MTGILLGWIRRLRLSAMCSVLLVSVVADVVGSPAFQLREVARQRAREQPGEVVDIPAPPGEYSPRTIEELAREAEVVVQATLSRGKSYLAASEDRVLTDYVIANPQVVAGRLPFLSTRTPGTPLPLILTVWGGEAFVEGALIRATDQNREAIKNGQQYLLFLMPSRSRKVGQYEIYYGCIFEIAQDDVRPLLRQAESVFSGTVDAKLKDLISRIKRVR